MRKVWPVVLVAAVLAVPAFGQDSTSLAWIIGDAVYPWDDASAFYGSEQCNQFVVDLENFRSSWGNGFRIAPLIKASQVGNSSPYLNCLISAQGMSNTMQAVSDFAFGNYELWTQPTYGVNNDPARNTAPNNPQNPAGPSLQFGVGFSEYGTSDWGSSIANIIGGVVNTYPYNPDEPYNPDRLYVARIIAAVNQAPAAQEEASFGFGSVDSDGHVHFRADGYLCNGPSVILGQNYFRVSQQARNCAARNEIDNAGGSDAAATAWLMQYIDPNDPTHNPPNIIPAELAGRPVLMGADFYTQYVYEQTAGSVVKTTAHLDPALNDHRGTVGFSHRLTCRAGSQGTAGVLGLDSVWRPLNINLWDVDNNGNVLPVGTPAPYSLAVDPNDPAFTNLDPNGATFGPWMGFYHWKSQTAYNGGNSQVAIGKDQDGRGLAAAVMYDMDADNMDPNNYYFGYNNPYNAVVVGRFNCGDPANVQWAVAAYVTLQTAGDHTTWTGSQITNAKGSVIAEISPMWMTTGADPNDFAAYRRGPSMSAPAIDSVGNVYFLSACHFMDDPNYPDGYYSSGLIRAVYRPDTFDYDLELVFRNRQEFHGQNSNTDYEISFLSIVDNNSVNSGTLWSNNILQEGFADIDTSLMCPANPRTLGGLVVSASITYDVDDDGTYDPAAGSDEDYSVLLYLGGGYMLGDANCDGAVNGLDIDAFVAGLTGGESGWIAANPAQHTCDFWTACDINNDGSVNGLDIDPFVAVLVGCQ